MLRLILARHGETTGNREHRCQGQADIPLTDKGREQAARLAARLADESLNAAYASDLARAWDTMTIALAGRDVARYTEPRLREQSKGVWDGLTWDTIRAERADEYAAWQADHDVPPPGGEPLSAVVARVGDWLAEVRLDHLDGTVLVVAHGMVLRLVICLTLNIDPALEWSFDLDNAALAELHFFPEGAVLHRLNDIAHLLA
jgi:broad specificity phosphatase PhoE